MRVPCCAGHVCAFGRDLEWSCFFLDLHLLHSHVHLACAAVESDPTPSAPTEAKAKSKLTVDVPNTRNHISLLDNLVSEKELAELVELGQVAQYTSSEVGWQATSGLAGY